MPKKTILIVCGKRDAHVDTMIVRLRKMGHQPVRVDGADFPHESSFCLEYGTAELRRYLRTPNFHVPLEEIASVWWREFNGATIPQEWGRHERAYARREISHALQGMWALTDCYWMSHPRHIVHATWKPGQLNRAHKLGFDTPRTIVTNEPDAALRFCSECAGQIVLKSMSNPILADRLVKVLEQKDARGLSTTILSREDILRYAPLIRNTPCHLQEYVEKQYELRVTIIGERVFAAAIDSQAKEKTKIDWRQFDDEDPVRMTAIRLPREVEEKCLAFVKSYGLTFSAMDLIVTPDGKYVFLESNPTGNWMFVERAVPELKMIDCMARTLARELDGEPPLPPAGPAPQTHGIVTGNLSPSP